MENLYLLKPCRSINEPTGYVSPRQGPATLAEKGLTVVHPFYNEQTRFNLQCANWAQWSDYVKNHVQVTIIDDGSPNPVDKYITKDQSQHLSDLNFSIYRILPDLKWNTPGALNLGLTVAPTEWVLIMDSDCAFDSASMEALLASDPEPNAIYKFPRKRIGDVKKGENLDNTRYLPCTMLMHKSLIWRFGGFDEDFTGEYSGGYAFFDTDFDARVTGTNRYPTFIWNNITAIEWMPSQANGEIVDRREVDERINRKLFYEKKEARDPKDGNNPSPILRFPWKRTYHSERS